MTVLSVEGEAKLAEFIASFYDDPLGFVLAVYPWGEPTLADGSHNPLANKTGPEPWQRRLLEQLGEHIKNNTFLVNTGLDLDVWRSARASGHGVGKSALVAWIIQFLMSTRRDTRGVVTANTARQLEDKTWPELAKWHNLLINKHWFEWSATSYTFVLYPEEQRKNYRVTAMTVSEENTEAFAGLHNEGKTVFIIFDEASGIAPKVWEVADGALTDGEGFFFAFGNPTRPDGSFFDCFNEHADLYNLEHVDSREVSHTNKQALYDMIKKYGDDSDEIKIRIKGMFPSKAFNGFIGVDILQDAIAREHVPDSGAALIMSVDVARFGDDESVVGFRQGRDARSRKFMSFKGLSTTKLAEIAMKVADKERPDAIVIESTGPGAGVIDIMRDRGYRVIEVHPGALSSRAEHYTNKRAEMWGDMRDWIAEEGCLPDDKELFHQISQVLYSFGRNATAIRLEPKDEYKKRVGGSPDRADALALTFGVRIARRDARFAKQTSAQQHNTAITEYDPVNY